MFNPLRDTPALLETLEAVWRLVETLDIGTAEKLAIRDLIAPVLESADGQSIGLGTAAEKNGRLWPELVAGELEKDRSRPGE
jgi:hypothetical protein